MNLSIEMEEGVYALLAAMARTLDTTPELLAQQLLQERLVARSVKRSPEQLQNWATFEKNLPELLKTHPDKYVAIVNGEIVGLGIEKIPLFKEMCAKYGKAPMLVTQVTKKLRIVHIG